jgi:hypothetical protein
MPTTDDTQRCPGTYRPVLEEQSSCIRYICDVCGDEADDLLGPEPCRRLMPVQGDRTGVASPPDTRLSEE